MQFSIVYIKPYKMCFETLKCTNWAAHSSQGTMYIEMEDISDLTGQPSWSVASRVLVGRPSFQKPQLLFTVVHGGGLFIDSMVAHSISFLNLIALRLWLAWGFKKWVWLVVSLVNWICIFRMSYGWKATLMIINVGYVTESLCHNEECMQSMPSVRYEIMNKYTATQVTTV